MPEEETYSIDQVADLIESALGARPSAWSLTHARPEPASGRSSRAGQGALTAGLPAPIDNPKSPPEPARWSAVEIDGWLSEHPELRRQQAKINLAIAAVGGDIEAAVRYASSVGLSWRVIAQIVTNASGTSISHEMLRRRYGKTT